MKQILVFTLIANAVSALLVVSVNHFTDFLGLKTLADYAFFVVILLWGTAALFWMYPPQGGFASSDDRAESVADSMVDRSESNAIDESRYSDNTLFCLKMALSGTPAFLLCFLSYWL